MHYDFSEAGQAPPPRKFFFADHEKHGEYKNIIIGLVRVRHREREREREREEEEEEEEREKPSEEENLRERRLRV